MVVGERKRFRTVLGAGALALAAVAVTVCTLVWAQHSDGDANRKNTDERMLSDGGAFGAFAPVTDAERELERLLHGNEEAIDLGLANWLIAADIPQFQNMSREDYFKKLDAMTEHVRRDMEMMGPVVRSRGGDPNTPHARCSIFCGAMIRLKFDYSEEFQRENLTPAQMNALYADADNITLAGLLRTRRGSCVSMPLIYLVIGQRLGLPVHLVAVGKHYFIRWEEPDYRMNIETTIVEQVAMTPDDSVHLEIEGMTLDQIRGSEMRNLTPREVVGHLFFTREGYWSAKGSQFEEARCRDLARALYFATDDPAIQGQYAEVFIRGGTKLEMPNKSERTP